jgi:hypothetical protein
MSSSSDVRTPRPLEINGLWQFFPEIAYREGEPDPPPLGPFKVRGDYKVERKERDVPIQRFLILKPEEGCTLPKHDEYAVEYPEKLIAASFVTFEHKGRAQRIRAELSGSGFCILELLGNHRPVWKYVVYEQQVEGTWIPIESDGDVLRP